MSVDGCRRGEWSFSPCPPVIPPPDAIWMPFVRYINMNIEAVRDYCLTKKGCEESFPFDDKTLVFKVMGKMFAVLCLDNPDLVIVKCDPERAIELRERYSAVEPAFHFNKKYWNQIYFNADACDRLIYESIDHSLDEVVRKFTKKMKDEYAAM